MTLTLLTMLVAAALIAMWRGRLRLASGYLIATLVVSLAIGSGVVATMLLGVTQIKETRDMGTWNARTSIVLLGAGTTKLAGDNVPTVPFFGYSRVATAAQAYLACKAQQADCKLIVSGGDPQHHGATEADVYAKALSDLHVPANDLILERSSKNTFQNAIETTKLVSKERDLVLVASGFQLKRSLLYFRHFRQKVDGIPSDTLDVKIAFVPSSMNLLATDLLLHEQIGIARYYLYNALGWNVPKVR